MTEKDEGLLLDRQAESIGGALVMIAWAVAWAVTVMALSVSIATLVVCIRWAVG